MHRTNIAVTLLVTFIAGITFAHGQQQAERYVPIGQSPGMSGKHTHMGTIAAADAKARTLSVATAAGRSYSLTVTERTRIWLDQSRLKLTTLNGSFADLAVGSRVEVKPEGPGGQSAEWIKVEMTEPRTAAAPPR